MRATRWPVELARLTPLHSQLDSVDINVLVKWLLKVIFFICVLCEGGREEGSVYRRKEKGSVGK